MQHPLMTDLTGQQLLKAINDLTDVIRAANNEIFFVPMAVEVTGKDDGGNVNALSCALSGVTFEDVVQAHNSGKTIFAKLADTTGAVYYIPLATLTVAATYTAFRFESLGTQNPAARPLFVQLMKMSNGNVYATCSVNRINARNVGCDVTIGGVQYADLASALAALAGG